MNGERSPCEKKELLETPIEQKEVYYASPTELSRRGVKSELYLIREDAEKEGTDEVLNKQKTREISPSPELEELGCSSEDLEKKEGIQEKDVEVLDKQSEPEFSLKEKEPVTQEQASLKFEQATEQLDTKRQLNPIQPQHNIEKSDAHDSPFKIEQGSESDKVKDSSINPEEIQKTNEEPNQDESTKPKRGPPPKKIVDKASPGSGPSIKRPIFKNRPNIVPKPAIQEEIKEQKNPEVLDNLVEETDKTIENKPILVITEDKDEQTAKKVHPSTIPAQEDLINKQISANEPEEDDLDIDIGWGVAKEKTAIQSHNVLQVESPTFGVRPKHLKPLAKVLTFGEKELKEVDGEKESVEKDDIKVQFSEFSSIKLDEKSSVSNEIIESKLSLTETITKESHIEQIDNDLDEKKPQLQESEEKNENKKAPAKKLFKQTKLIKKT